MHTLQGSNFAASAKLIQAEKEMEAKYRAASLAASTGDNQDGDDEDEEELPSSAVYS